jgi:hypothetical protein
MIVDIMGNTKYMEVIGPKGYRRDLRWLGSDDWYR